MNTALKVGTSVANLVALSKEPTKMDWGLQDISNADAGRVQDANNTMYKMRTSQKRKLNLEWSNLSIAEASEVLRAFDPEYVYVQYLDPKSGEYEIREFYTGDRSAPFRKIVLPSGAVMTTVSFNIIER